MPRTRPMTRAWTACPASRSRSTSTISTRPPSICTGNSATRIPFRYADSNGSTTMANLPVAALMFDPSDAHALQIPPDFSRRVTAMIPEAVQGRNSQASPLYGQDQRNLQLVAHYTGPQPPDTPRLCTADLGHHLADRRTRTGLLAQRDAARPRAFAGRRRRRHHADRQVLSSASQSVFRKHPCVMPQ